MNLVRTYTLMAELGVERLGRGDVDEDGHARYAHLRDRAVVPGRLVTVLQEELMELGYDIGGDGADGALGQGTQVAIGRFNREEKGLNQDFLLVGDRDKVGDGNGNGNGNGNVSIGVGVGGKVLEGLNHLKQFDSVWGQDEMSTRSLSAMGCAVTSLAMSCQTWDVETDPRELNEWLRENEGYYSYKKDGKDVKTNAIVWGKFSEFVQDRGGVSLKYQSLEGGENDPVLLNKCRELVDGGVPCLVRVKYHGEKESSRSYDHFVLGCGYETDEEDNVVNVRFMDPGSGQGDVYDGELSSLRKSKEDYTITKLDWYEPV